MRKSLIAATAALALAACGAAMPPALAAPPPPPGPMGGPPHPPPWAQHWGRPGMWGHHPHRRLIAPGTFALMFHPKDRKLTPTDVDAIATGFLRWNGNHSWKVIDVKATDDAHIGFAYATADGGVIARFTINRHTGRIRRVG
ncbi:MAG: hypothetical protein ACP5NP_05785 [Acetobacteraceae bacterium]